MKILVLQETDWIDRNPVLHHRMLESLSIAGHDVTVIDFDILWAKKGLRPLLSRRRKVEPVRKFFPDSRVTVLRPSMIRVPTLGRISWLVNNWVEIRRILEGERPDVVVSYGLSNALLGLTLARQHHTAFVAHFLDALHTLGEPEFLQPIARIVERRIARSSDRVIVVNDDLRNYVVRMGAEPSKVEVIPQGVNARRPDRAAGEEVRAAHGIGSDDLVLLFLGWLYTFSGLRELSAAMRERVNPRVKLLVVGDGDLLPELIAAKEALGDRLIITGRRPLAEVQAFISAADVCLLPSHKNKTMEHIVPAKVIEYMEAGKFVVATRLNGLQTEFGSLAGIRYIDDPADTLDVAEELLATGNGRERARQLGESCFEFMSRRGSWNDVTERFEEVLAGAARAAGREVATLIGGVH